jgi:hypothetical protein
MEAPLRTRLTASEGRRFGMTVGGAFLLLALMTGWRGHTTLMTVFATVGGMLALAGLIFPSHLGPVERSWMRMARAISRVTTPILMGVIYLLVLTPVGVLRRVFDGNPLTHEAADRSYWKSRPADRRRSASLQRQFGWVVPIVWLLSTA